MKLLMKERNEIWQHKLFMVLYFEDFVDWENFLDVAEDQRQKGKESCVLKVIDEDDATPIHVCVFKQCFFFVFFMTYKKLWVLLLAICSSVMCDGVPVRWGSHQMIPAEPRAPLLLIAPPGHGLNVENWCWLFKGLQYFGWMQRTSF